MTPMTLEQRLRDGKGADRELDREIEQYFLPGKLMVKTKEGHRESDPIAFTSDLNAVFALVERELPEWTASASYLHGSTADGVQWILAKTPPKHEPCRRATTGVCVGEPWNVSTWCRALLLALLAAKEPRP